MLSLKRSLLEARAQSSALEESVSAVVHERDSARRQLEACRVESQKQLEAVQREVRGGGGGGWEVVLGGRWYRVGGVGRRWCKVRDEGGGGVG